MKSMAKRMAGIIGGVTIAAFLLTLAAPKAVHAIVSTLVTVSNTAANPVPIRAADNPARQAVLLTASLELPDGQASDRTALLDSNLAQFTVPAGQRLVVDSVSGNAGTPSGQTPTQIAIMGNSQTSIYPVATFQGSSSGYNLFSYATSYTTYVDPGSQPQAFCSRGPSSSGIAICNFFVAGHLESIQ
jgi:hypothetical protein